MHDEIVFEFPEEICVQKKGCNQETERKNWCWKQKIPKVCKCTKKYSNAHAYKSDIKDIG